jgi:hypothetical protein
MRRFVLSLISTAAVLVPVVAFAQADQVITSPPSVTAAGADWQTGGVPVLYNGETYQPTGSRVFFDANVMVKVGTFRGVPFYADRTREPNTIVYVPVSGGQVRAYERRASRELEGTVDSRVPELPGDSASAPEAKPTVVIPPVPVVVGPPAPVVVGPTHMASIPRPPSNSGIWIEFKGARWHNAGKAVLYSPSRFTRVGEYHGFPVYRARKGKADLIYVTAVQGGPLVPYRQ